MAEILPKEIERISSDIDLQGLTYTRLKDEILDHICCQIEIEMENGLSFNHAYRKVKISMGRKRLRQIQDETLYLINKKYRRMKKIMNGMGIAVPIMMIAGATFKVMHWPGASIIITLALFTAAAIFLPLFVMVRIRDTRNRDEEIPMGLYITGMIAAMISIIGTLFKVQHWPGASIMLTVGLLMLAFAVFPIFTVVKVREAKKNNEKLNKPLLIGGVIAIILTLTGALFKIMHWPGAGLVILSSWSLVAVIVLPMLVLRQLRKTENQTNRFIWIIVVSVGFSLFILAWVRSVPRAAMEGYYFPEYQLVETADFLELRSERLLQGQDLESGPQFSEELQSLVGSADELCMYISECRIKVAEQLSDVEDEAIDEAGNLNIKKVYRIDNTWAFWDLLVEQDEYRIYDMLLGFRTQALALSPDKELESYIKKAIDLNGLEEDTRESWAKYYFGAHYLQSMTVLGMYESAVRLIENEILRSGI